MEVDNSYGISRDSFILGAGAGGATFNRHSHGVHNGTKASLFEEIALPDFFLDDYYSQVIYLLHIGLVNLSIQMSVL